MTILNDFQFLEKISLLVQKVFLENLDQSSMMNSFILNYWIKSNTKFFYKIFTMVIFLYQFVCKPWQTKKDH